MQSAQAASSRAFSAVLIGRSQSSGGAGTAGGSSVLDGLDTVFFRFNIEFFRTGGARVNFMTLLLFPSLTVFVDRYDRTERLRSASDIIL